MNDYNFSKFDSYRKTIDFLSDNAAKVAARSKIPPLAITFNNVVTSIGTTIGLADQDNRGYTLDKYEKVTEVKRIMLKIGRAAASYYSGGVNNSKLLISDFTKSELEHMKDSYLPIPAQKLHDEALPDVANLEGVDAADFVALQAAIVALIAALPEPKRATELSELHNDNLKPLMQQADKIRSELDLHMQTFIDEDPLLYAEWKLSLSIDNNPTHSNPDLATPVTCGGLGVVTTVDYAPIVAEFTGAADIKFILPQNIPQGVAVGFGADDSSFVSEQALSSGSNNRVTAASLGYDINAATFLNIRNATPNPVIVNVAFYLDA